MKPIITLIAALTLFVPSLSWAYTLVGESLPIEISAQDQNTEPQTFDKLTGKNGLVLVFTRSAEWCPYCQMQMIDFQGAYEDIKAQGYNLATVSYDSIAALEKFSEKNGIRYKMLSDDGSKIIKAFGLLNEDMEEGSRFYGIPHPAIYVISRDGIVQGRFAEEGYEKRPSINTILMFLKSPSE